jgi:hypothetical protein
LKAVNPFGNDLEDEETGSEGRKDQPKVEEMTYFGKYVHPYLLGTCLTKLRKT